MSSNSIISIPGVLRPTLYLAGPVLLEQLLNALVGLVDTWLTGHYVPGAPAMAAIGLMAYTMWLLESVFSSVAIGATALVARFMGAGDESLARHITNQAFICGGVVAGVAMLALHLFGESYVHALNMNGEAAQLAHRYIQYLVWVVPAMMVLKVGAACLRGAGDTVTGFVAITWLNAVNLMVGATLVTGLGGAPQIGWDGLAIGTVAGHVIGAAFILWRLIQGRRGLKLEWPLLKPNMSLASRLLRIGLPGGADMAVVLACHLWFVRIVNSIGELESSAHMLAVRMESLAYLPGTAFQVAAATMAGQYLGAGDFRRASRGVMVASALGLATGIAVGLWFYFGAPSLLGFFVGGTNDPTAAAAVPVLELAAFAMPSLLLTMVLSGALRGAGDTRWPLLITLIGMLGIRIPIAYGLLQPANDIDFFGQALPIGLLGAWFAMVVDVVARSLFAMARFLHGGWKSTSV